MDILVKRAMKGDGKAFGELINLNLQSMYKTAWVYLRNEQDIADAISETTLACYEKIGTLKNVKYFRTWLIRILINKCNDILRERKHYGVNSAREQGRNCGELEWCEWKELLLCLDEESREIVQLYYFDEFTTKEIGEILGMNKNTVATRLDRARKRLKREIRWEVQP